MLYGVENTHPDPKPWMVLVEAREAPVEVRDCPVSLLLQWHKVRRIDKDKVLSGKVSNLQSFMLSQKYDSSFVISYLSERASNF